MVTLASRWSTMWGIVHVALGGILVGYAISLMPTPPPAGLAQVVLFIVVAIASGWVELEIEPQGSISLTPLVFLTAAAVHSYWLAILIAALAPLAPMVGKRSAASVVEALERGGEASLALLLAAWTLTAAKENFRLAGVLPLSLFISASYFLLDLGQRMLKLSLVERIRVYRSIAPLARTTLAHYGPMTAAAGLIAYLGDYVGFLAMFAAMIVYIQSYYPWKLRAEQKALFMKSLQMISQLVDIKDPYTSHHSERVARYSVMMARAMSVDEAEVARIRIGALMHDIGKIRVPGRIIRKPGKLTDEEMDTMKAHVADGAGIISELDVLRDSAEVVYHHHEHFGGGGYPSGLRGEKIPLGSRIILVADAFDALNTDRPYRQGRSAKQALNVIEASTGTQFDPTVVKSLRSVVRI